MFVISIHSEISKDGGNGISATGGKVIFWCNSSVSKININDL